MDSISRMLLMASNQKKPVGPEYIGDVSSIADSTSYTFSATSLGAPEAGRIVFVAVGMISDVGVANTISSVTVGGVAATLCVKRDAVARLQTGLFMISNATDATADIVVSLTTANARRCIVAVFALYGHASATVFNSATFGQINSVPMQISVNTPAAGLLVSISQKDGGWGVFSAGIASTVYTNTGLESVGMTLGWTYTTAATTPTVIESTWNSSLSGQMVGASLSLT